jgi:hypothetical protein
VVPVIAAFVNVNDVKEYNSTAGQIPAFVACICCVKLKIPEAEFLLTTAFVADIIAP